MQAQGEQHPRLTCQPLRSSSPSPPASPPLSLPPLPANSGYAVGAAGHPWQTISEPGIHHKKLPISGQPCHCKLLGMLIPRAKEVHVRFAACTPAQSTMLLPGQKPPVT